MEILSKITYAIMLLSAIGIVGLVLLQHGKGADMGTGFGAGASGSLFGATGSANFLSRTTAVLAAIFFCSTLALAYFASSRPRVNAGVMENVPTQTLPRAPAPVPPARKADERQPAGVQPAGVPNSPAAPVPSKSGEIPK